MVKARLQLVIPLKIYDVVQTDISEYILHRGSDKVFVTHISVIDVINKNVRAQHTDKSNIYNDNRLKCVSNAESVNYGWLVFNGTFSTKRLYHAIGESSVLRQL